MYKLCILNHNQRYFGTYYRCFNIGTHLAGLGYHVDLICASEKKFDLKVRKYKISSNLYVLTLPRFLYGKFFSGQLLRLFIATFHVLLKGYDGVYAFTMAQPQISWPAVFFKLVTRKQLIIDWDDLWGGGFAEYHHPFIAKVLKWHETKFLNFADSITYVSDELFFIIQTHLKKNIKLLKLVNGCYPERYKQIEKNVARDILNIRDTKVIMSIGNTYTEGLGELLQAFKIISRDCQNTKLYFVGIDCFPVEYSDYNSNPNIVFIGKVPFERLSLYMSSCDVLALPMGNNMIEKCRFPMRFVDYLVSGRPIVSNAVGEVKSYISKYNAGYVARNGDPIDFSLKLRDALDDNKRTNEIVINQMKLVSNELNNHYVFQQLDALFQNA